jgi:hypothetical protein
MQPRTAGHDVVGLIISLGILLAKSPSFICELNLGRRTFFSNRAVGKTLTFQSRFRNVRPACILDMHSQGDKPAYRI